MIKELAKVATRLDALGLTKEADAVDALIRKMAAATRTIAPTINTHLIREVVYQRLNEKEKEANKTTSSYDMDRVQKGIKYLNAFLDNAGDKVYVTTNDNFTYWLWLEDPLDPRSKADPRKEDSMSIRLTAPELIDAIGKDHFNHIKEGAREAGYIADEITRSGYGEWQFSGDTSELDMMGYTPDVLK